MSNIEQDIKTLDLKPEAVIPWTTCWKTRNAFSDYACVIDKQKSPSSQNNR